MPAPIDNTSYVEMIHPKHHGAVKLPVSPRHNGGRSVEFYRAKGFRTLDEKARDDELAELRAYKAESESKPRRRSTAME